MTTDSASPSSGARPRPWLTIPNVLSILRLATVPIFVYLFVSGRELAAVILYAVGALTDFFDGLIARRFDQVSELGKLLDPLADRIFIAALMIALVARDAVPLWVAVVVLGRDLAILGLFPLLERRGIERIEVNFVGKLATAALLFGLTVIAAAFVTTASDREVGTGLVYLGAALYWVAAGMYALQARDRLRRVAERKGFA